MRQKLFNLGIILSFVIGSMVAFGFYLERYLNYNTELMQQIKNLLKDAGVLENRYIVFFGILLVLCTLVFWVLEFILYKIVFRCAKVKVEDVHMLMGIGAGMILSFLTGYVLVGHLHIVLLTLISNLVEILVIFFSLYDKIRGRIKMCGVVRGAFLVINLLISVYKL